MSGRRRRRTFAEASPEERLVLVEQVEHRALWQAGRRPGELSPETEALYRRLRLAWADDSTTDDELEQLGAEAGRYLTTLEPEEAAELVGRWLRFVHALSNFPDEARTSGDYFRIVGRRRFARLRELLHEARRPFVEGGPQ